MKTPKVKSRQLTVVVSACTMSLYPIGGTVESSEGPVLRPTQQVIRNCKDLCRIYHSCSVLN